MSDIKLPCKMEPWDGRVVDANDMYVDIDEVLRRVNYHARLVEALRRMVAAEDCSRDAPGILFDAAEEARTLLAELEQQP